MNTRDYVKAILDEPGHAEHLGSCGVCRGLLSQIEIYQTALKFYADPNNYQKGYAPPERDIDSLKKGLLTEPLVIQDGGKIAIEALK